MNSGYISRTHQERYCCKVVQKPQNLKSIVVKEVDPNRDPDLVLYSACQQAARSVFGAR